MAAREKVEPPRYHILIAGVTMCGKTTLAHKIAEDEAAKKDGRQIIVYDPVLTPTAVGEWPEGSDLFDDKEKFLAYLENLEGSEYLIFIDESDDLLSHSYPENTRIVRRGRHYGWQVVLITQRPNLLSPSARSQCGMAYLFALKQDDMRSIAGDYAHNDLHKIKLEQGDYLCIGGGSSKVVRGNIFRQLTRRNQAWTESATISKSR